ncbi:putative MFS monocarboxylate transporter [Podospora appendiculata]|uniref:MFS monocarboxylate transporter n=1 Tax=Podospora appendiculata TaxID=314037 RepID=A0AAE0WZ36_9PEZI|nr:putative MFS monocarboxylate transporter [Podospora appendiculata]
MHPSLGAWLVVAGASCSLFCGVGFLNAFGVFQDYYKTNMLQDMSDSNISWIGSVSIFLLYLLSPVAGILVDRFGPTILLIGGSIGTLLAVFMTSLCTEFYQFFLAQAVLLGMSMSFLTLPPLSVVSRRLPQHRGLALGIVVGGSSVGGILWPVMLERLLSHTNLGFGWVMRIVGFTMLPLLAFACATVLEPPPSHKTTTTPPLETLSDSSNANLPTKDDKSKTWDISILKNKVFLMLAAGLSIVYLGLFIPPFYISTYATAQTIAPEASFYLISIMNGASLLGRVLPGHFADRYGHFNVFSLAILSSGVIAFCWTAATNLVGLIFWGLAYGFTSGAIISLQSACAGNIADHGTQGTAMGLLMGAVSITSLVGTPIGGSLVTKYGYLALSMFSGATLLAGSLLIIFARLMLNRTPWAVI